MGIYSTQADTHLDEIISGLRARIERLERTTRLPASSIDTGNLEVKDGNVIVKGAILKPMSVVSVSTSIPQEGPLVNMDAGYAPWLTIPKPEWATHCALTATGTVYTTNISTVSYPIGGSYSFVKFQFGTNLGNIVATSGQTPSSQTPVYQLAAVTDPVLYIATGMGPIIGSYSFEDGMEDIEYVRCRALGVYTGNQPMDPSSWFQPAWTLQAIFTREEA